MCLGTRYQPHNLAAVFIFQQEVHQTIIANLNITNSRQVFNQRFLMYYLVSVKYIAKQGASLQRTQQKVILPVGESVMIVKSKVLKSAPRADIPRPANIRDREVVIRPVEGRRSGVFPPDGSHLQPTPA